MNMRALILVLFVASFLMFYPQNVSAQERTCDAGDCTSDSNNECDSVDCESEAPYVLRILKSGEGAPRSSNETEEGRADNRRADVTLTRKVPVEELPTEVQQTQFDSGGTVWLSKDPTSLQRTLSATAPSKVSVVDSALESPVEFEVVSNYVHFIDKLELLLYEADASSASKPILVKALDPALSWQSVEWDLDGLSTEIEAGLELQYALRASDDEGHIDVTERRALYFDVPDASDGQDLLVPEITVDQALEQELDELPGIERESIPLYGTMVRILGQDLTPGSTILINEHRASVDKEGRFVLELLLPDGEHEFEVSRVGKDDAVALQSLRVDLDSNYLFMVGLADLTIGKNNVSGSVEPLAADDHHYDGDIFVDGRLAFYLKGKVKGKYLVTAQMDTGTEDIENLFDDFHRKDPNSVFRRLDPDQYYPVYGDDSQLVDDTDSQGKLYVRVDWDRSRAIWGNFNTNFNETEFAPFNRSLYGVQLRHESTRDTVLGDATHSLNVFGSRAQSLFRHNEFLGTGGSLYYLSDSDIVAGSEKVSVEIRESDTERVVERIILVEGRDYTIDDFQGRIILRRPLLSVTAQTGPSIIRDEPLDGNQTFLVVDYEYVPANFDLDDNSVGARAQKWVGDHIGIGGTVAQEIRDGEDYSLLGADVIVKKSELTFIKVEAAETESAQTSGSFISNDGGLSFDPVTTNGEFVSGSAVGVEARVALNDFRPDAAALDVGLWTKHRTAGFSTSNSEVDVDTTDLGVELVASPTERVVVSARATHVEREDQGRETSVAGQVDVQVNDRLTLSGEIRDRREDNLVSGTDGTSSIAGAQVAYDVNEQLNVYGAHQITLRNSGSETPNDGTTLGATYNASSRIGITGEVSSGDRGDSALIGVDLGVSDTYSIYSNYTYSLSREEFRKDTFVIGQRKSVSSQLQVYSEHQFSDEDDRNGFAHTVGLDQKLTEYTSVSVSIQRAVIDNGEPTEIERDTISTGVVYQKDNTRFSSKLEYRWDEGEDIDTRQWVTTNRLDYRPSVALRWQGQLNASVTEDQLADDDARFLEAGIGFAYRPVSHDRLNMLGRLTYLNDLQPMSQADGADERSLIASIEGLYDINRFWSTGAKFAHRTSEIRLERDEGIWIDNDASLASARIRYKALFGVDATAAYHWMGSNNTDGNRHGALFTIGRRVRNNLTFSVGYNFTSFDDDLTDDSFDARGWFLNLVGTY